jgi:DNA-binding MarR family transcriptional regulator
VVSRQTDPAGSPQSQELRDLTTGLQVVLGRLSRTLRREAPSPLGPGALGVLHTLAAEGPLRAGDLAAREGVRPPTMTRILTVLEDGGYVVRTEDPTDRRASLVVITQAGSELLRGTRNARASRLAQLLATLDPAQRAKLAEALPVLEAIAGGESSVDSDAGSSPRL